MFKDQELLREISKWKLEAKLEDNDRYFYHLDELKSIEDGTHCYVIGRKGTGKTAISEYLLKKQHPKVFAVKLSFKNFPFNDLYKLENTSYQPPNQYITLWKYLIYSSVAKLFIKNHNIDSLLRDKLEQIYSDDPIISLPRTISRWTGKSFDVGILGNKLAKGGNQTLIENDNTWIERVQILENLILENLDDCSYRIIFDELDEDYKDILNPQKQNQYTSLLTSLFKAVQDVKAVFQNSSQSLLPVIFLRDDIYSLLSDPDKTKWDDLTIELDWNTTSIKSLLAFRISRATTSIEYILSFDEAWKHIFFEKFFSTEKNIKIPIFHHITLHSLIRPRDYIRYIKVCTDDTLSRGFPKITNETVRRVNPAFSNYMRSEWEDEIHGFLPEIRQIIDVLSQIRKRVFTIEEFTTTYNAEIEKGTIEEKNIEFVLRALFYFSVIGNQPVGQDYKIFRYRNKELRVNLSEPFCIHNGLVRSLGILF